MKSLPRIEKYKEENMSIFPGQGNKNIWKDRHVCVRAKLLQLCPALCDPMDYNPRLLCPWDFPGKNTGVGCHFLLQRGLPNLGIKLASLYLSCSGWQIL